MSIDAAECRERAQRARSSESVAKLRDIIVALVACECATAAGDGCDNVVIEHEQIARRVVSEGGGLMRGGMIRSGALYDMARTAAFDVLRARGFTVMDGSGKLRIDWTA